MKARVSPGGLPLIATGLNSTFTTTCSVTLPKRRVYRFATYLGPKRTHEWARTNGESSFRRRAPDPDPLMRWSRLPQGAGNCFCSVRSPETPLREPKAHLICCVVSCGVGGEFSSLYQNSFHHYRDFWCFDISTQSWDRIDTKVRPTARSGHRYVARGGQDIRGSDSLMLGWPFGSITSSCLVASTIRGIPVCSTVLAVCLLSDNWAANYLNDLWLFDMQEYKWKQTVMKVNERKPS